MVKLFSCKAHDGDYFWLRYKHDEEKLYHNLVIDGGRKSNASDFYEMLKHICKNGEQIDAMVLTHFDQDHIMGMFAGLQKAQKKNYIPKIAALYLNTGKGYWKHHQSLEGSEPLPEETVKIPMTDAPGYSANDLKKLTDFLQEYGLEEHICSYIVQSCEEIHIGNAKCYIISPSDASLKDLIQNFSDFMQVSPVTPYGGADPEWSKPLDELSGYDTPEDTSLSNGASIETIQSQSPTLRLGSNVFPAELVRERMVQLNSEHIRFVLDSFRARSGNIRNPKKYLLAMLFNAPITLNSKTAIDAQAMLKCSRKRQI